MPKINAKVNASFSNYTYLNIGKEESLRVPTGNFKDGIPQPGSVCEVSYDREGRLQFPDKSISTYRVASGFKVHSVKEAGVMIDDDAPASSPEPTQPVEQAVVEATEVSPDDVPF